MFTNVPEPRRRGRGSRAWRIALLAAVLAAAGCGGERPGETRGLVVIVIDTLRGDRPGYAGYDPAVTPTLDSLAAAGTVFTRAMTPVPVTLPAVASLLTGRLPLHHGVRDNDRFTLDPGEVTLAEGFRARGWRTEAVVASAVLARDRGTDQGFDHYDADFGGPYPVYEPSQRHLAEEFAATRRRADRVTDLALERLRAVGDDPFFLLVHYFDVHMHLDPPPRYAALHPDRPYDGETSFVDAEIGRLLAALRGREDVLVVVTADHGESQGEHGEPQHGFLLYESTLHVPLVVSGPGAPAGAVRDDVVSLVDLGATLFARFDLPVDSPPLDGRVLVWDRPETGPAVHYAETLRPLVSYGWRELRAVREGRWKFIEGPPDELYDLANDPAELVDLGAAAPADRLRAALHEIVGDDDAERVLRESRAQPDPARRELLESLGYVAGSPDDDAPAVRPHPRDELPRWLARQWAKEETRRAAVRLEDGAAAEARTRLDSVLAVDPRLADAWYLRGLARAETGDDVGARGDYRACLERDPDHAGALAALALAAEDRGAEDEALALWSRVFVADENHEGAVLHLSTHYLEHRDPAAALPYLRRLAALRPDDPAVRFNLGLAARLTGQKREARENFTIYLQLAPEGPSAADAREYLKD